MTSLGKWSKAGVPHKGWSCVEIEDLGEPSATCEMCEHQAIRFVHYMQHPSYGQTFACGCDCAGRMEENCEAALTRDKKLRSRARRKKGWPKLKAWYRSQKGNLTLQKDGFRMTVFKKSDGYRAVVSNNQLNFERWSRRTFPTEAAAQLASFEVFADISD